MSSTTMKKIGTLIGCEGLVFAKLTADTSGASGATTYDASLFEAPGVQEIALSAQTTSEQLPADDIPLYEQVNLLDGYELSVTMAALGSDAVAWLLGHSIDTNGVLVKKDSDVAPYVAVGFKTPRSDGSMDYIWFYKGQFAPGDETFRTKEKGKVNWQTPTIKGTFGSRISDHMIQTVVNDKDTLAASILATFFSAPYTPDFDTSGGGGGSGEEEP